MVVIRPSALPFHSLAKRIASCSFRSCSSGGHRPMTPRARTARIPDSSTALATSSIWSYISTKVVVPPFIISTMDRRVPHRTSSAVNLASLGHIFSESHTCRARSSP
ncbi:hypothetical protein D3C81_1872950 [compost metagenome]